MSESKSKFKIKDFRWKNKVCPVCGKTFEYLRGKNPRTCSNSDCQYKYRYRIDVSEWKNPPRSVRKLIKRERAVVYGRN